nr:trichohyalin-like [Hydra vulgaris]
MSAAKSAGKELAPSAINTAKDVVVDKGKQLILLYKKIKWQLLTYKDIATTAVIAENQGFAIRQSYLIQKPTYTTWRLGVKTSTEKTRYIIVGFQMNKGVDQTANPTIFDHCDLKNMQITNDVQIRATFNQVVPVGTQVNAVVISDEMLQFQANGKRMNMNQYLDSDEEEEMIIRLEEEKMIIRLEEERRRIETEDDLLYYLEKERLEEKDRLEEILIEDKRIISEGQSIIREDEERRLVVEEDIVNYLEEDEVEMSIDGKNRIEILIDEFRIKREEQRIRALEEERRRIERRQEEILQDQIRLDEERRQLDEERRKLDEERRQLDEESDSVDFGYDSKCNEEDIIQEQIILEQMRLEQMRRKEE